MEKKKNKKTKKQNTFVSERIASEDIAINCLY